MRHIIQSTLISAFSLVLACSAAAETEMLLPYSPALTPDGSSVIFSWEGDLWMKSTDPNDTSYAKRLTYHPGMEFKPIISRDGKTLYFNSNREGSLQIFKVSLNQIGSPQQLTFNSSSNILEDLAPDQSTVYYTSVRDAGGRSPFRAFSQNITKKSPEKMLFNAAAKSCKISPDGTKILLTREGVDPYRKGYVGTQASQIWLYDKATKTFSQPVQDPAGCRSPLWLPDGSGFYYLCGKGGVFNLWKHDFATNTNSQLTNEHEDSLMFPAISADGSTIIFRKLFHHYTYNTKSGKINKLTYKHNLQLNLQRDPRDASFTKCSDADFSPSGLEIVLSVNGDLFAMDTILREPIQLTHTSARESNTFFAEKGKAIYFLYDDGIKTAIKKITKKNPLQYWWQADKTTTTTLITADSTIETFMPSPNGKLIAYTTVAGRLFIYDLAKKSSKLIASSWDPPSFDWSPDSKWITYSYADNNFNNDIFLAPVDGSKAPVNITKHPDNEFSPAFSPDGNKIAFIGKRQGTSYDLYYVDLTPPGKEKPSRLKTIEAAEKAMKRDPAYRTPSSKIKSAIKHLLNKNTPKKPAAKQPAAKQPAAKKPTQKPTQKPKAPASKPTIPTAPAHPAKPATKPTKPAVKPTPAITPEIKNSKPKAAAQPAKTKNVKQKKKAPKKPRYALKNVQKRIVRLPLKGVSPGRILWRPDSRSILLISRSGTYAIDTASKRISPFTKQTGSPIRFNKRGELYWISAGYPSILRGNKSSAYKPLGQTKYSKSDYQRHIFRVIWRTMRDGFYDSHLNGKNWDAIRVKYENAATYAPSSRAFDRIIALLLGELNASHCGFTNSHPSPTWAKKSPWKEEMRHLGVKYTKQANGWHVNIVLPNGPADKVQSKLNVGDIITSINGTTVSDKTRDYDVLWGQMKHLLTLRVRDPEGHKRTVTIAPISFRTAGSLMQEFNINRSQEQVEKLSHGRLGYIHISRMMWDEFLKFEQHLYENGAGKDGLVIDVRDNGGGFTTDHLLTALMQPRHAFTVPRNGGKGYPQDRFVYATWNKPIVILCNQNSFSNAEIFAHAIRTLKRGQIVGVATAGGVISAGSKSILAAGKLRMPFRGWFNINTGEDLELNGCQPHHVVWPKPGELETGIDRQLEKAVQVLTQEVKQKKAASRAVQPRYHSRQHK